MRVAIFGLLGVALAGCDYMPALPGGGTDVTARRAEFITVVEAAGCRLDWMDNEAVLVPANFSDEEAGALGGMLISEGVAEIDGEGDLVLLTENCL